MKKVILLSVILLLSATAFAQTAPAKLGYVDSQVILAQYPEAIKAQSDLDALVAKWEAQIDSMAKALQQAYGDFQKQQASMTEDARKQAQQKLILQEQEINVFRQQKFNQQNGEYFVKNEELMGPIRQKILTAIEEVAGEEDVQFMFDKSGDIVLLYADEAYDMTFKVLDRLKRGKK